MSRQKTPEVDPDMTPNVLILYFAKVPDPRIEGSHFHSLSSILLMSLCAVICGAESFVAIEDFGRRKAAWLGGFLDLPNAIPPHDAVGRLLAALNPRALADALREWVWAVARLTRGQAAAMDVETLRRTFREAGASAFVPLASAWTTTNRIVLGQARTAGKSNDTTAIPRLLQLLELDGCLVTIDAPGCRKEIARQIVESKADYLLAVKDDQPSLRDSLVRLFDAARTRPAVLAAMDHHQTEDEGRNGVEVRRCWTTSGIDALATWRDWKNLHGIALIEVDRTVKGRTSTEQRYYLCSRKHLAARDALAAARSHWGIGNAVHWVLDVAFDDDQRPLRVGRAAENFALLRRLALNLLRSAQGPNVGIRTGRARAARDEEFLTRVLAATPVAG